jgi:hypothetical protein
MGNFDQIWDNLLKISQGDASLYERATSSFEQRTGSSQTSSGAQSGQAGTSNISGLHSGLNTRPRG